MELKGEIQRHARDAAAFDHRDDNFKLSIIANWTSPEEDAANIDKFDRLRELKRKFDPTNFFRMNQNIAP